VLDFFALILDCIVDIQYWFKIKKRRKFEKENNLPKRIVWHPLTKPFLILLLILLPILIVVSILRYSNE
jgi:general secretion pathway protein G